MEEKKEEGVFLKFVGIIAFIISFSIMRYTGISFLIPIFGAIISWWLLSKYTKPSFKEMVPAVAVQMGHAFWFIVALLLIFIIYGINADFTSLLDLLIIVVGLTWLIRKPGLKPIIFLLIYQMISIFVNLYDFITFDFGSDPHRYMLIHLLLRITAVTLMIIGYKSFHKNSASEQLWYYAEGDRQIGPISEAKLKETFKDNLLGLDTLVWSESIKEWTPASKVEIFASSTKPIPPPLPKQTLHD